MFLWADAAILVSTEQTRIVLLICQDENIPRSYSNPVPGKMADTVKKLLKINSKDFSKEVSIY